MNEIIDSINFKVHTNNIFHEEISIVWILGIICFCSYLLAFISTLSTFKKLLLTHNCRSIPILYVIFSLFQFLLLVIYSVKKEDIPLLIVSLINLFFFTLFWVNYNIIDVYCKYHYYKNENTETLENNNCVIVETEDTLNNSNLSARNDLNLRNKDSTNYSNLFKIVINKENSYDGVVYIIINAFKLEYFNNIVSKMTIIRDIIINSSNKTKIIIEIFIRTNLSFALIVFSTFFIYNYCDNDYAASIAIVSEIGTYLALLQNIYDAFLNGKFGFIEENIINSVFCSCFISLIYALLKKNSVMLIPNLIGFIISSLVIFLQKQFEMKRQNMFYS